MSTGWDIQNTPEWHRLTVQQGFFVQSFMLNGDAHAAVRSAYPGVNEHNISRMAYAIPRSKRVAAVLKLWSGVAPKPSKKRKIKMSDTTGWSFRLAEPRDAEAFAAWSLGNPQIDPKDREAGTKKQNPTVIYFVAEHDGEIISFAPLYAQMVLPFLVFNPKSNAKDRKQALQTLMDGVSAVAVQFGIREIATLSKEKYPVAKWALKNKFKLDPRQTLKWNLNEAMESAAPVAAAAPEVQAA
jgi:hypothetical protein